MLGGDEVMPKEGTLERLMIDRMMESEVGVTYLDFVGTGITEDNIDQIAQNLRTGMYEMEDDELVRKDD
jgi:hypothetical protein